MRKTIALLLICFLSIAHATCDVVDDAGQVLRLKEPAHRIISLAPDLTELLFAAGAGASLVGVAKGSDFPRTALTLPIISAYDNIQSEAILALHPDLIVVWSGGNAASQLHVLHRLGIPLYFSQQRDVTDIPKTLHRLGCLAGTVDIADRAATNFLKRYAVLQQRYQHRKKITVFYSVWSHPLMTLNKDSWVNQIITLCGGENIFANAKGIAPTINPEAVLRANPDVFLSTESENVASNMWRAWSSLNAVRCHHIFAINPDDLERAGPRLLNGAAKVCQDIDRARKEVCMPNSA